MSKPRPIHPELQIELQGYDESLIALFLQLRKDILALYPASNELIYKTHALTTVFSPSLKLGDAFCHIPIYSKHFNLGFNKGTLLDDPGQLLQGTGKFIRHIPIQTKADFQNAKVKSLIQAAINFSLEDMDIPSKVVGQSISKIKKKP